MTMKAIDIKYGEITITNKNNPILSKLIRYFGHESKISDSSDIIILFDEDKSVIDTKDIQNDSHFGFYTGLNCSIPSWIDRDNKDGMREMFFYKKPTLINGEFTLIFKYIFNNFEKYNKEYKYNIVPSIFNCIYFRNTQTEKEDIFSIQKIASNETNQRYIFAYDCNEFTRNDIAYIVEVIFKNINTEI